MEQPASWTTAELRSPGCALSLVLPAVLLCPSLALLVFYLSLVLLDCRLLHLLQPLLRLRFFIVIYVSTEKTVPTSCMSPGFIVIDLGRAALGGGYYSDIHRLMWWSVLFLRCMILRRRAMGWEPTFFLAQVLWPIILPLLWSDNTPPYTDGSENLLVLHDLTYSIPLLQQFVCHFTCLELKNRILMT